MKTLMLIISIIFFGGCITFDTRMDKMCLEECKSRFEFVEDAVWHGTDLYWDVERCVCFFEEGERAILMDRKD